MAVTIAGTWSGSFAPSLTVTGPPFPPATQPLTVAVANTPGDWMIAIVSWRQVPGGSAVTIASVADDSRANWWEPLGAPSGTSSATGVTRTAIWRCPAANAATMVQASPTGFVLAIAMIVLDVAGMATWVTESATVTGYANAATALSMSVGAPASQSLMIACAGSDLLTATVTGPGAGWTSLSAVTAQNGDAGDHTSDLRLSAAWRLATTGETASWSSTGSLDFSGTLGGVLAAAPAIAQVNPDWPVTICEAAIGSGQYSTADTMTWTALPAPFLALDFTQGRQYELSQLAAGSGTLTIDNPAGILMPPGFAASAGIDSGTPVRLRCYWPGTTPWYMPFSGFFERLPQQWGNDMLRNITDATIVDCWASLIENMQPILPDEILNDNPGVYYPCTDLPGSTIASNLAPGTGGPLVVTQSKYGTGGATQAFGANSGAIPGAQGTLVISPQFRVSSQAGMWGETTPAVMSYFGQGFNLQGTGPFPPLAGGVTLEFWFQLDGANLETDTIYETLLMVTHGRNPLFVVYADYSPAFPIGTGNLLLWPGGGGGPFPVLSAANYQVNPSPLTHLVLTFNRVTWTAYINGTQAASGSWSATQPPAFTKLIINGDPDLWVLPGRPASAFFGHIAVYPYILHPLRIATHYQAGVNGMVQDTASGRVNRLLQASTDASFRRFIPDETAMRFGGGLDQVVSCQDIPGNPVGTAVGSISGAVPPGLVVITPPGEIYFLAKQYAFGQASRWTLGENVAGGEIPFRTGIGLGYDPTRVLNDIRLTQLDDGSVTSPSVTAVVAASQAQYGQITLNDTGYLHGDVTVPLGYGPGLLDQANWLACTDRSPLLRGETVSVDAASYPAAWPLVLGAACGDMVTLNTRPQGFARTGTSPAVTVTGRVSQTHRTLVFGQGGQAKGTIEMIIDAAPESSPITCDDPVKGLLNQKNVIAW